MKVVVLRAAQREIASASAYYDEQGDGLGKQFLTEFLDAAERIKSFPELYPRVSRTARKCTLKTFPYNMVYRYDPKIRVLTIAVVCHQHRDPRYWRKQVTQDDLDFAGQGFLNRRTGHLRNHCRRIKLDALSNHDSRLHTTPRQDASELPAPDAAQFSGAGGGGVSRT